MYKTCHLEVFTFSKYFTDLSTDFNANKLSYPEDTYFDFSIDDFKHMLLTHDLHYTNEDLLKMKEQLINNKCLSTVYTYEIAGDKYEKQVLIILKLF